MKIGICEDEAVFLDFENQKVNTFLKANGESAQVDSFADGIPLLDQYRAGTRYDLLLLDLQMPGSDGMDIARSIRQYDETVPIIFVTGVENRAVEGYHVDALDYVLKSRLEQGLDAALSRFLEKRKANTLALETAEGDTLVLPFHEILWIESEKRGTKITTSTKIHYSPQPIGKISALLPEKQFMEIHKSIFVQLRAIKRLGGDYVEMLDGSQLPLSRRKKKLVMSSVLELVKGRI